MLKAFKYEINPTMVQKTLLNKTFGCVRFAYNWGLNEKTKAYQTDKSKVSCFELINRITLLKKQEEFSWLNEIHSQPLQMAMRNLDNAFTNFFNKRVAFPNFKKKSNNQSFQYPQGVKLKDNQVFFPKIGWTHFYKSRECFGEIKTVTVSKTPTNKYFVSILCETTIEKPTKKPIEDKTSLGIDVGIKTFAVCSDGQVFENQKYLSKSLKNLKKEQRTLARRYKKGVKIVEQSKGYHKQRIVVAKLHEKVSNQRNDFLHKVSTKLVNQYDSIIVEDLNVKGMLKNNKLSKAISDVSWTKFNTFLQYKCEWQGKNYIQIGRFVPSSKMCNHCGHINKELKLKDREWTCQECQRTNDRDFNASLNIKSFGLGTQPKIHNVSH
jgi:putative transposase